MSCIWQKNLKMFQRFLFIWYNILFSCLIFKSQNLVYLVVCTFLFCTKLLYFIAVINLNSDDLHYVIPLATVSLDLETLRWGPQHLQQSPKICCPQPWASNPPAFKARTSQDTSITLPRRACQRPLHQSLLNEVDVHQGCIWQNISVYFKQK